MTYAHTRPIRLPYGWCVSIRRTFVLILQTRAQSKNALEIFVERISWKVASKEEVYQCNAPSHPGRKKLYGRVQQVFIKQNTKFWCGTMNPKVLSGVWILLMCVLCWWNEACFNDHTTQQCCAPICCQHFGGLLLYYYVLLSHCCFVRRHTHTHTCVWRQWGRTVLGGIFKRFWEKVKMQCFWSDVSILKSSTDLR